MTLIVENGSGIYEANSYAGRGFIRDYLTRRNRAASWDASTEAQRDAACIAATDYIDRRFGHRFKGQKLYSALSVYASNILQLRATPVDGDTVTIGTVTYTFRTAAATVNEVTIGSDSSEAAGALVAAVLGTGGGVGTVAHPSASAALLDAPGDVIVRALVAGALADPITTTSSSASLVWDTAELTGGDDDAEQVLQWPRDYAYSRDGNLMEGIPLQLKQAVAEYAERALTGALMPDPTVDESGAARTYAREKVGPLETEYRYAGGSSMQIFQKYPAADRLLIDLLVDVGGVYR